MVIKPHQLLVGFFLYATIKLKLLVSKKGSHGLLIARKHMNWTCRGFEGASTLRHKLVRAKTPKDAIELLEEELIKFN